MSEDRYRKPLLRDIWYFYRAERLYLLQVRISCSPFQVQLVFIPFVLVQNPIRSCGQPKPIPINPFTLLKYHWCTLEPCLRLKLVLKVFYVLLILKFHSMQMFVFAGSEGGNVSRAKHGAQARRHLRDHVR